MISESWPFEEGLYWCNQRPYPVTAKKQGKQILVRTFHNKWLSEREYVAISEHGASVLFTPVLERNPFSSQFFHYLKIGVYTMFIFAQEIVLMAFRVLSVCGVAYALLPDRFQSELVPDSAWIGFAAGVMMLMCHLWWHKDVPLYSNDTADKVYTFFVRMTSAVALLCWGLLTAYGIALLLVDPANSTTVGTSVVLAYVLCLSESLVFCLITD